MTDLETTQASLLVRIRDQNDRESWARFMQIYAPLIFKFLRSRGLREVDAEDLAQDVLGRVASAIKEFHYSPDKGRFRGWLFTIVENCLRKFLAEKRPGQTGTGDTRMLHTLQNIPAAALEDEWGQEYQRHLLQQAATDVRGDFQDRTWQAFWSTAVEGHSSPEVAAQLGMTVAAVYMARHRVTNRLREHIRYLEGERT